MRALARCFGAEALKLRRTAAPWVALALPAGLALLLAWRFRRPVELLMPLAPSQDDLFRQAALGTWGSLLLPLLAVVATAGAVWVEGERGWTHLRALPVPRAAVLGAKLLAAHALALGASLLVGALAMGAAAALQGGNPALHPGAREAGALLRGALLLYAGAWPLLALHFWVAARARSYGAAVSLGACALVGAMVASLGAGDGAIRFLPWLLPRATLDPDLAELALPVAVVAGVVLSALAIADLSRAELE